MLFIPYAFYFIKGVPCSNIVFVEISNKKIAMLTSIESFLNVFPSISLVLRTGVCMAKVLVPVANASEFNVQLGQYVVSISKAFYLQWFVDLVESECQH